MSAARPKLDRVIETCLYADDLERAARFYEGVLGLPVMTADSRFRAYDVGGRSVLLIFRRGATLETVHMPGGTIPPHDGHGDLHVAFAIAADELADWERRPTASPSKAVPNGREEERASISATRTATSWNWPLRGCGLFIRSSAARMSDGACFRAGPGRDADNDLHSGNFATILRIAWTTQWPRANEERDG